MDDETEIEMLKAKIKSRIFLGKFEERRLVPTLLDYRDIVVVSPAEEELTQVLLNIKNELIINKFQQWIGITLENGSIVLWINNMKNLPSGAYWFQVSGVFTTCKEISIQVKCLHYIPDKFIQTETIFHTEGDAVQNLVKSLSSQNIFKVLKFIIAVLCFLVLCSFELISFSSKFVIYILRKTSYIAHQSMPSIFKIFNFILKIFDMMVGLLIKIFRSPIQSRF